MFENIAYWLFTSYRRKNIDRDLYSIKKYFSGRVLDIGGGHERGNFQKNRNKNWVIADIDKTFNPDVVCDVQKLPFKNNSFDVVKATELFLYVDQPQKGLSECFRVLKKGGFLVLSFPFLTPVDTEQHDGYRLSEYWIKNNLKRLKSKVILFKVQGVFFTVLADYLKWWISHWYFPFRILAYFVLLPLLDLAVMIEDRKLISKHKFFKRFPSGYFVVSQKK